LLLFVLFLNHFYVFSFSFFQFCPSHVVSFNFYISNLVLILLVVIFLDHFFIWFFVLNLIPKYFVSFYIFISNLVFILLIAIFFYHFSIYIIFQLHPSTLVDWKFDFVNFLGLPSTWLVSVSRPKSLVLKICLSWLWFFYIFLNWFFLILSFDIGLVGNLFSLFSSLFFLRDYHNLIFRVTSLVFFLLFFF
jgi:hypothetical protein